MYLFVYGTLRRTTNTTMYQHFLKEDAEYIGDAIYRGKIYVVDIYPGVVPSDDEQDMVFGEVFKLKDPGELILRIDEYEGCSDDFPRPWLYYRDEVEVTLTDSGETIPVWIYLYNRDPEAKQLPRITSGDYMDVFGNV